MFLAKNPKKRARNTQFRREPERIKQAAIVSKSGNVIKHEKEYELFDLTAESDSDDNDEGVGSTAPSTSCSDGSE